MKKILTLTSGILLSGILLSQVPFEVEKELNVSKDGDTTEVISNITNVGFIFKSKAKDSFVKLILENRDFGVKVNTKKIKLVKYETPGEGLGGLTVYTCESEELGNVVIEEELQTMTGKIKFDRNRDGIFEEILVLR